MSENPDNDEDTTPESTWGQSALRKASGGPASRRMVGAAWSGEGAVGGTDPDHTQPSPDATPGGSVPGGGSGRSNVGTSNGVRSGPRPIRGPRFSGGPMIAGLGLLSLLVVMVIMAILVVKVLDGTRSTAVIDQIAPQMSVVPPGPSSGSDAGSSDASSGGSSDTTGAGATSGTGAVGAAAAGSCLADRATVETAVMAYEVMNDRSPASIDDLVSESLLADGQDRFELRGGPDGVDVVGIGPCEGVG